MRASEIISLHETTPNRWKAKYEGNYGVYTVKITLDKKGDVSDFSCTCPSDGYPCKHIPIVRRAIAERMSQNQRPAGEKGSPQAVEELLGRRAEQTDSKLERAIMIANQIVREIQRRDPDRWVRQLSIPRERESQGGNNMWKAIEMVGRGSPWNPDVSPGKFKAEWRHTDPTIREIKTKAGSTPVEYIKQARELVVGRMQRERPDLMQIALKAGINPTYLNHQHSNTPAIRTSGDLLEATVLQLMQYNANARTETLYAQVKCDSTQEQEAVNCIMRVADEAGITILSLKKRGASQVQLAYSNQSAISDQLHKLKLMRQARSVVHLAKEGAQYTPN